MFSEYGYDKTSVRDLVKKADVNIASVNYHFGGKRGLYYEVLDQITKYMDSWAVPIIKKYDDFIKDSENNFELESTIQWLDDFINDFLNNIFNFYEENLLIYKIIKREQLKSNSNVENIYQMATIKLLEQIISNILSKYSKLPLDDKKIIIYTSSIIGQIETFTSMQNNLKFESLTKDDISIIKRLIINHIESIFSKFL